MSLAKLPHQVNPPEIAGPPARVIHINAITAPGDSQIVYIGRGMKDADGRFRALLGIKGGRYLAGSPWANPYPIEKDTYPLRLQSIRRFRSHIWESSIRARIHELRGKVLACWCHPKPCHGDVWADLANKILFMGSPCPQCGSPVGSDLRPAQHDRDEILEHWRCPRCRAYGHAPRGPVLFHLPEPQGELFSAL